MLDRPLGFDHSVRLGCRDPHLGPAQEKHEFIYSLYPPDGFSVRSRKRSSTRMPNSRRRIQLPAAKKDIGAKMPDHAGAAAVARLEREQGADLVLGR